MKFIIDRIEEDIAVCEKEDGEIIDIRMEDIIGNPKEGDTLIVKENKIYINKQETLMRKKIIYDKSKDLWK